MPCAGRISLIEELARSKIMSSAFSKFEKIFLLFITLLSMGLVLVATSRYGLGLSTDSVYYLSGADNIAAGRGFLDFKGFPLTLWPPLLPFIIGLVSKLTGFTTLLISEIANLLCLALIIFSGGLLLKTSALDKRYWFYIGTFSISISVSLISLASNIVTDLSFILFSILFLLTMKSYCKNKSRKALLLMALIAGLSALLRWIGVSFILIGAVLISIQNWGRWKLWFKDNLIFGFLASLPFVLWTVGRNYSLTHNFVGHRSIADIDPFGNLAFSYARISQWFLPNSITKRVDIFIFLFIGILILALINKRGEIKKWGESLFGSSNIVFLIFIPVYFVSMIFTTITNDHTAQYDDRYQLIIFLPLLIILFITIEKLLLLRLAKWNRLANVAVIALLGVWLSYHGFLTYRFIQASLGEGVAYYNIYNVRDYRQSGFIDFLQHYEFIEDIPFYSNNASAVYLYTKRQVDNSSNDTISFLASDEYLMSEVISWPPEDMAYLIWFTPNLKRNYYSPAQLEAVSSLELVHSEPDGEVYLVRPK